ncbi:MAG: T9SS type A sorting domain-containing protein [Flavobacterium sp.]|nr:T9SS type A sorting domain-containing protein [Flavobacterium sp.]
MKKFLFLLFIFSTTTFAQLTWSPITTIPTDTNGQRYDDVFFLNENLGWAIKGYYSSLYKTTDGGLTWIEQIPNGGLGGYYYFRNVEFIDENIGFIGTLSSKFYKTIDGGTTWNLVTNISPNPQAICGMDAVGTSTIYGCGAYFSPAYIIKSVDSGTTWQYINMSAYADALVEVLFIDENTGFASGNNAIGSIIIKTTDGGINWTNLYQGNIAGQYVWKLQILANTSNNTIFGSVESIAPVPNTTQIPGRMVKSVDGGLNWISKDVPDPDVQAIGFVDENHGWIGGHNTGFYETLDGGDTWTNLSVGSNLNRILFLNDNLAYACGTTIYKMTNSLYNTSFQEQNRLPLNVRIAPNPIKDKLNVEIDFRANDNLLLGLYSQSGQLIKILKKDLISNQGTKFYSFDFPYASGIYILNLHTNTGRQSVKIIK